MENGKINVKLKSVRSQAPTGRGRDPAEKKNNFLNWKNNITVLKFVTE